MTLPASIRRDAATLSARLPSLIIAARRVAQTVRHGVHGRRRAGSGETFWQFRPFLSGEPSSRVDWRRSAREERAFVREREWEAAHTVWIWFDRSASMQFAFESRRRSQRSTGRLCWRWLSPIFACAAASAQVCSVSRGRWRRKASSSASPRRLRPTSGSGAPRKPPLPPALPAAPRSMVLMIGDFLSEPEDDRACNPGRERGGRDRRTGDDRRSDRGNLSVLRQHGVSPSRRLSDACSPRGRKTCATRISRGLPPIVKRSAAICARSGWGMSIHRTDGSPAEMLLALRMRLSAPEPGAGLRSA